MAAGGETKAGSEGRDLRDEHGLVLAVCKGRRQRSVGVAPRPSAIAGSPPTPPSPRPVLRSMSL